MKLVLVSAAFLVAAFNASAPPVIATPFICKTIKANGSSVGSAVAVARITDPDVNARRDQQAWLENRSAPAAASIRAKDGTAVRG